MRARGAQVTDIVVLVVAADDRVMPQTIEAIDHAKAAERADRGRDQQDRPARPREPDRDQARSSPSHGVVVEEFGGKYVSVEISAKKGTNVERLLEMILLAAGAARSQGRPDRRAKGVVLEARVEQGRGVVASVLVAERHAARRRRVRRRPALRPRARDVRRARQTR